MKNYILITMIFLFPVIPVTAQFYSYEKTYGHPGDDFGQFIIQTKPDSGYIITGHTYSSGGGKSDIYLVRLRPNGDTLWTRAYGDTTFEYGYCVQQTYDGGFIIAGTTSTIDIISDDVVGTGNSDVYLIRTDANGDTLWTRIYGGPSYEEGYYVQETPIDSGYIITGFTQSFGAGNYDVYLIKTNKNGDTLWTKTYGGNNFDAGYCVQLTTTGGYVITGFTDSYGAGNSDVLAIRTDSGGNLIWQNTYGGNGPDGGNAIRQAVDSGFIITGYYGSNSQGSNEIYLIRTDENGGTLWTKTYESSGSDFGNYVYQTTDTGFAVVGYDGTGPFTGSVYLIRTNKTGDTLWTKAIGGFADNYGSCVQHCLDGGFALVGFSNSFGAGGYDIYMIKTDQNGKTACNQYIRSTNSLVIAPSDQVANFSPVVSAGGNKLNINSFISHGAVITDLCQGNIGMPEPVPANIISCSVFPNPLGSDGHLSYELRSASEVIIEIFDAIGEKISTLCSGKRNAGANIEKLSVSNLTDGIYFIIIRTPDGNLSSMMSVAR